MVSVFNDFEKYLKSMKVHNSIISKYKSNVEEITSFPLSGINIFDKLLNDRIIFLNTEIDDYSAEIIKANLLYLDHMSNEDITIYINSPGGSVYSGLGILDTIDFIESDVSTINTGLAASMSAVILCSGKKGKRKSLKRSRTMIHQPLSFGGWQQQASDMEIEAKEINFLKKELYEIISENTGQTYEKVEKDSDRNYWMSAKDAKKYGMIDEIIIKK